MRVKTDAVDYKYFPEPNITPIRLSDAFVQDAIDTCPELYDAKRERYLAAGLSGTDADIILSNIDMAAFFEASIATKPALSKIVANFLIVEINAYLNKKGIEMKDLPLLPATLADIAAFQNDGYTHKQCADILVHVLENGGTAE